VSQSIGTQARGFKERDDLLFLIMIVAVRNIDSLNQGLIEIQDVKVITTIRAKLNTCISCICEDEILRCGNNSVNFLQILKIDDVKEVSISIKAKQQVSISISNLDISKVAYELKTGDVSSHSPLVNTFIICLNIKVVTAILRGYCKAGKTSWAIIEYKFGGEWTQGTADIKLVDKVQLITIVDRDQISNQEKLSNSFLFCSDGDREIRDWGEFHILKEIDGGEEAFAVDSI